VLLPQAGLLDEVNTEFKKILTEETLRGIVALIPDEWLQWRDTEETPEALRETYFQFLFTRINHSEIFTNEAKHAGKTLI
jgi:hypothetical protein